MKYIVGIDVSKAKLDCLWLREVASRKKKAKVVKNDTSGHATLATWLTNTITASPEEIMVVMEATGIYHNRLAMALYERGFKVFVINPAKIKHYANSLGNTHKTDKQDSLIIALYGDSTPNLTVWQPEPVEIRELKALIARIEALEVDFNRENNRLEKAEFSLSSETVIQSIQLMLTQLKQERGRIEKEIDDHIDRYPRLKKDKKLLASIPGIGPVMTRLMLSVIHSRSFDSAKQVAAYLGVIPKLVESGVMKGRSTLSKKGPASVRAKLYMAAIVATQWNPDVTDMTNRLLNNGKSKMQALGAAMRKLVHICFGVINTQAEYVPQVR